MYRSSRINCDNCFVDRCKYFNSKVNFGAELSIYYRMVKRKGDCFTNMLKQTVTLTDFPHNNKIYDKGDGLAAHRGSD